jgi:plastocyanin
VRKIAPTQERGTKMARIEPDRSRAGNRPWNVQPRASVRTLVHGLAIGIVCCHATTAAAGRLQGQVTLTAMPAGIQQQAALSPYAGSLGSICTGSMTLRAASDDVRDVVISLRSPTAPPVTPVTRRPQLAQRGQAFEPRVLGVAVNTTVEFPNFDPIFHNVFSYSKAKRFDLGKYGQGKTATVRFDKPGLVKVFCDIHSNMTAFVYVTETPWVVQPDDKGRFVLDGLPDGTYTLEMWHPERGTRSQTVEVTDSGTRVDLTF